MPDRGYTNDPFGYLPPPLQNEFIKEGHNRFAPVREARKAGRKDVKAALKEHKAATKGQSTQTVAEAGGKVYGARQARKSAVAAAKVERKEHREAKGSGRRGKKIAKLEKRAERLKSKQPRAAAVPSSGGY